MVTQVDAIVELKDVTKNYQLGKTTVEALKGVNLKLIKGEFTALVGASGSGKSTLLNMIGCIDDPDRGEVLFDGKNCVTLNDEQKSFLRNQKIGFIFQSFNLVPVLTVGENVELPLLVNPHISKLDRVQRVKEALSDVGLGDLANNLPDQLSGGQRQRVAIARALAAHPPLVLADEPTANLDSVTSAKIVDLMIQLNQKKGITFLFSTHDDRLMEKVSRIVKIKDGKIES